MKLNCCAWKLPVLWQWFVSSSSFVALRTGCKARWSSLVQILTMLKAMPNTSRMKGPNCRKPFTRQLSTLVRLSRPLKMVTLVWRRWTWNSHGRTRRLAVAPSSRPLAPESFAPLRFSLSLSLFLRALEVLRPSRGPRRSTLEVTMAAETKMKELYCTRMSHPDLRDKAGCVSYVRQRRTTHIMMECIEINVTIIIT
jgi:hypothetical protein